MPFLANRPRLRQGFFPGGAPLLAISVPKKLRPAQEQIPRIDAVWGVVLGCFGAAFGGSWGVGGGSRNGFGVSWNALGEANITQDDTKTNNDQQQSMENLYLKKMKIHIYVILYIYTLQMHLRNDLKEINLHVFVALSNRASVKQDLSCNHWLYKWLINY